ncbi:hypothetical protein KIPB_008137, partial [Kipferlia bialata]|eukprot:g8137.t1
MDHLPMESHPTQGEPMAMRERERELHTQHVEPIPQRQEPIPPQHQEPIQPIQPIHTQPPQPIRAQPSEAMPPQHQAPMPTQRQEPIQPIHPQRQAPIPPQHQGPIPMGERERERAIPPQHQEPMQPIRAHPEPIQPMRVQRPESLPPQHQQPIPPQQPIPMGEREREREREAMGMPIREREREIPRDPIPPQHQEPIHPSSKREAMHRGGLEEMREVHNRLTDDMSRPMPMNPMESMGMAPRGHVVHDDPTLPAPQRPAVITIVPFSSVSGYRKDSLQPGSITGNPPPGSMTTYQQYMSQHGQEPMQIGGMSLGINGYDPTTQEPRQDAPKPKRKYTPRPKPRAKRILKVLDPVRTRAICIDICREEQENNCKFLVEQVSQDNDSGYTYIRYRCNHKKCPRRLVIRQLVDKTYTFQVQKSHSHNAEDTTNYQRKVPSTFFLKYQQSLVVGGAVDNKEELQKMVCAELNMVDGTSKCDYHFFHPRSRMTALMKKWKQQRDAQGIATQSALDAGAPM